MKQEIENLSESDAQVRQMLASLERVDSPKDFEFRLKARIANARPGAYRTNYKRRFAYMLPASALAVVSAFMAINGNFSGGTNQAAMIPAGGIPSPPVSMTRPQNETSSPAINNSPVNVPEKKEASENIPSAPSFSADKSGAPTPSYVAVNSFDRPKPKIRRETLTPNLGGSKVEATTSANVIFPNGFNPTPKISNSNANFVQGKQLSAQDIIAELGIETATANGVLKVRSVRRNSLAERAGIKVDDVIETLNGQKISGEPMSGRTIQVKKIGVRRGAEQTEINLSGTQK